MENNLNYDYMEIFDFDYYMEEVLFFVNNMEVMMVDIEALIKMSFLHIAY